jgi:uncharacterized protein YjeT (DUF2065 family)
MTKTTQPGKPGSSVEERLGAVEAALDDFEDGLGLPRGQPVASQSAVRELLEATPEQLRSMGAIELGEGAVLLEQFAFHVQRAVNRQQARARRCEEGIKKALSGSIHRQQASSAEERKMMAIANNSVAERLHAAMVDAQLRIDRLAYLAQRANDMSRAIMALASTKRGVP